MSRDARWLTGAAGLLLVAWSFAVPVFEGPDEHLHWQYARYLHDRWQLPVYDRFFVEANSPPLYYAAIAPVAERTATPPPVGWFDGRDRFVAPFTPRFHLTADDDQGRYWPIRRARLLTVLMAVIAIAFCARAGLEATGLASTALLAAGFAAFLPQFAYRGSHVANDVLVTAMAAWLTWLIVRIVRHGFTWRIGTWAAIAVAGAYLSKINGLALALPLALAILTESIPWRRRLTHLGVFGVTALLAAPWTIRNVLLYGEPFAARAMYHAVSDQIYERSLWDPHFVTTFPRELFKSFVGRFGYFTVKLPKWVYAAYLLFFVGAFAGLVPRLRERREEIRLVAVLAAIVGSVFAVVLRINVQIDQPQGRFLFPALPAIVLLMALGLEGWRPWRGGARRMWPARLTTAGWGAANVLVLALVIVPAYHPPLLPTVSESLTIVRPDAVRDLAPATAQAPSPAVSSAGAPTAATQAGPGPAGVASWTIAGPQPTFAADVRTHTSNALFVIFDIEARTSAPGAAEGAARDVSGSCVFTLDSGAEVRVPFDWRADGRRRTIYLTLLKNPAWIGTVTAMRLEPAGNAGEALRGTTVTLQRVRLAGSIPSHDY